MASPLSHKFSRNKSATVCDVMTVKDRSVKNLTDEEIFKIARPIWVNMNICSNNVDYVGFSRDFSDKLRETLTIDRFESQCEKHEILTSLIPHAEPLACIRRKEGFGIVFRQLSSTQEGEFMGNLIINISDGKAEVIDATIY